MEVTIPCPCPPKADGAARHESDTVTLRDKLDFRAVTAIRNGVAYAKLDDPDISSAEIMAILTEGYILHGIESWSLVALGEKGRPQAQPVTKTAIRERLLADPFVAESIGDAADGLYGPAVLLPLVQRALASSQPSQTEPSTSQKTRGPSEDRPAKPSSSKPRKSPKPSKQSSTSTTGTAGIATITSLHAGGSNSSPSSASAA